MSLLKGAIYSFYNYLITTNKNDYLRVKSFATSRIKFAFFYNIIKVKAPIFHTGIHSLYCEKQANSLPLFRLFSEINLSVFYYLREKILKKEIFKQKISCDISRSIFNMYDQVLLS